MSQIYKDAGVDLSAGDSMSKHAARVSASSWKNNPFVRVIDRSQGNFRGPRTFLPVGLPSGTEFLLGADGIGTKTSLHTEALTHAQAAIDLAAMLGGDQTRYGAMPLILSNLLDVATLGTPGSPTYGCFETLFDGLRSAASGEEVVLLGGEIAELGNFVGSDNPDAVTKFNWAGFMIGAYHPRVAITGEHIKAGQMVVAFREYGFRSNGMSAVRKTAFPYAFGHRWWENPKAMPAIKKAAMPSMLYDRLFVEANGWHSPTFARRIPIAGIAHLTGGGIPEKLGSLLFPTGYSAELDDLWDPPEIMQECAGWIREADLERIVPDEEFYRFWNGGQGAFAILDQSKVAAFEGLARKYSIEMKACGKVVSKPGKPEIRLRSKFSSNKPWLEFS